MITAERVDQVRETVAEWRREGLSVGLVPTMGALHEGHASLVRKAAEECDRVIASVFVNPTQFGRNEDLDSYPRDFERDCEILEREGCSMVFHPEVAEMYPEGFSTYVTPEGGMTGCLCGRSRPGHFRGVCTVVSKLFNITTPDRAYFGEKDAQQLAVIKRMVRDLNIPVTVCGCPTVREADGLAKSSRNKYLSPEERRDAAVLYEALQAGRRVIEAGGGHAKSADVLRAVRETLERLPSVRIDYVEVVDGESLSPVDMCGPGTLVAAAVFIGETRLIDNFTV
ncbi:MAG: pantoate--beta-alanine ligase [Clostridiales bacterium]|nr:pantoate--beta-alanine ligase [Clostridiales bacterium]MDD7035389.1 pantoate--beta-alanine ligase [Bacillota bacterium]MDY2920808.1 pantoate--beta-alanine ligase [Lentihominibacter sp.]